MEIRAASAIDAHAIAVIHVRAWRAAYRGVIPDAVLAELSVDKRETMWRNAIAEGTVVFVAEDAGEMIGWIAVGRSRDKDAPADVAEIFAIHVHPGHWHRGVGRLLWQSAREHLHTSPFEGVTLWVLEKNEQARRFYSSIGFAEDPGVSKRADIGGTTLIEVRYRRTLAA